MSLITTFKKLLGSQKQQKKFLVRLSEYEKDEELPFDGYYERFWPLFGDKQNKRFKLISHRILVGDKVPLELWIYQDTKYDYHLIVKKDVDSIEYIGLTIPDDYLDFVCKTDNWAEIEYLYDGIWYPEYHYESGEYMDLKEKSCDSCARCIELYTKSD